MNKFSYLIVCLILSMVLPYHSYANDKHDAIIGNCPLCKDAYLGNLNNLKDHISNDMDVNESDKNGVTALFAAVEGGHVRIVKFLIKHGADANQKVANTPPIYMAALLGNYQIMKLMAINKTDVNSLADNGFSPLMAAASGDFSDKENYLAVKLLLRYNASIDHQDENGVTALMIAAGRGDNRTVKALLHENADIKLYDKNKNTAIDYARKFGFSETIEIINRYKK